jgi:hypothetical protein
MTRDHNACTGVLIRGPTRRHPYVLYLFFIFILLPCHFYAFQSSSMSFTLLVVSLEGRRLQEGGAGLLDFVFCILNGLLMNT